MRVTSYLGATDMAAQQHVEGRCTITVGMDFGTDEGSQFIVVVDEAGKVTCLMDADDYYAAEKRRRDRQRAQAWSALKVWLAGGLRHGR